MSSVNEASSLFGGADNGGSDPFDSIGGTPSLDAHSSAQDPISDLFGNSTGSESNDTFANLHSTPAAPAQNHYAPPTQPSTQNGYSAPAPQQNAYAPPAAPSYAPPAAPSYAPPSTYGQPAYSSPYSPPSQLYSAPAQSYSAPAQAYGAPAQGYGSPAYGSVPIPVPAPPTADPKASVDSFRPKTMSAYDPPIPAAKKKSHAHRPPSAAPPSAYGQSPVTPYGQSAAYGQPPVNAYGQPPQQQQTGASGLPPPPRSGSAAPAPPPRAGSAAGHAPPPRSGSAAGYAPPSRTGSAAGHAPPPRSAFSPPPPTHAPPKRQPSVPPQSPYTPPPPPAHQPAYSPPQTQSPYSPPSQVYSPPPAQNHVHSPPSYLSSPPPPVQRMASPYDPPALSHAPSRAAPPTLNGVHAPPPPPVASAPPPPPAEAAHTDEPNLDFMEGGGSNEDFLTNIEESGEPSVDDIEGGASVDPEGGAEASLDEALDDPEGGAHVDVEPSVHSAGEELDAEGGISVDPEDGTSHDFEASTSGDVAASLSALTTREDVEGSADYDPEGGAANEDLEAADYFTGVGDETVTEQDTPPAVAKSYAPPPVTTANSYAPPPAPPANSYAPPPAPSSGQYARPPAPSAHGRNGSDSSNSAKTSPTAPPRPPSSAYTPPARTQESPYAPPRRLTTDSQYAPPPLPPAASSVYSPSMPSQAYTPPTSAGSMYSPPPPASVYSPPPSHAPPPAGATGMYSPPPVPIPGAPSVRSSLEATRPGTASSYDPPPAALQRAKAPAARVASPAASIKSNVSSHGQSTYGPYGVPYAAPSAAATVRDRAVSNGSATSAAGYAPLSVPPPLSVEPTLSSSSSGQTLTYSAQAPYAPSPSLLGTNDMLQRTARRAPVISFGFGGKLVTCFHGSGTLNTGFDVALAARQTTAVSVRSLHKLAPPSALGSEGGTAEFPGPLLGDPGSPTTGVGVNLVRGGASAAVKNNRAKVTKYLDERAEEMGRGIAYLSDERERRQAEARFVLVRLLKVMVENDGQLSGSPKIDVAVRAALVPSLADEIDGAGALSALPSGTDLALGTLSSASTLADDVLAQSTTRGSALTRIETALVRGDRQAAVASALDERLWAHAMVIASSVGKDAWKNVVDEFVRAELGGQGREGMRLAYSLYAGSGAKCVQALAPPAKLGEGAIPAPTASAGTIPAESLEKWAETIAMIIPGPSSAECSAALMSFGETLAANGYPEAAHVCYLLAPSSPVIQSLGAASARVVLLGARSPLSVPNFYTEHDPIVFSEIAEFAASLVPPPAKGQDSFTGCGHLQAYKLVRAAHLAELGHMTAAQRYCDAIAASLARLPPPAQQQLTQAFVEQLKELTTRMAAAPVLDKGGSWIGGKVGAAVGRPSLDSIGNWFEDRLTKFIAGEGESEGAAPAAAPPVPGPYGPFAHYSTISSAASSKPPSPAPTGMNPHVRPGSSASMRVPGLPPPPGIHIDRASSAMENRRAGSPASMPMQVPRTSSAAITTFAQSPSYYGNHGKLNGLQSVSSVPEGDGEQTAVATNGGGWWDSAYGSTPTAASFAQNDTASSNAEGGEFLSLMDTPQFGNTPAGTPAVGARTLPKDDFDDDDDLGLSTAASKKKKAESDAGAGDAKAKEHATRPDPTPKQTGKDSTASTAGSSWFGRLWGKRESTPGPIKATLGEESSFYYDKELKKWVNKKAGADTSKPATPPPPPSRTQTASPGHTHNGSALAPPSRPASAVDVTSPPKRAPPRGRSNLAPVDTDPNLPLRPPSAVQQPMTPLGMTPPPTPGARPKSSAAKRNIRSRYVDVFQQEGAQ